MLCVIANIVTEMTDLCSAVYSVFLGALNALRYSAHVHFVLFGHWDNARCSAPSGRLVLGCTADNKCLLTHSAVVCIDDH